jgi:hypothetical protein
VKASARRQWRRPSRQDVFAAGMVVLVVVSLSALAGVFYIETQFRPEGSLFGRPTRIPACGRSYLGPGRGWTRAEMEAAITPGYEPVVLEPTIGEVPLIPWVDHRRFGSGLVTCDTVIFLHVRPDFYVGYAIEGGP